MKSRILIFSPIVILLFGFIAEGTARTDSSEWRHNAYVITAGIGAIILSYAIYRSSKPSKA